MPAIEFDAATRIKTLIALTEELTAIFTKENASIVARRPDDIAGMQEDKARLSNALTQAIQEIATDRSVVAGAGDSLMTRLKSRMKLFEERAEEQRMLLARAGDAAHAAQ